MCFALSVFLFGIVTYRFRVRSDERNPFVQITRVFVRAVKNRHAAAALEGVAIEEERAHFSMSDIEDAKAILKLLPICLARLPFTIVYQQSTTFFTKQGATMDRFTERKCLETALEHGLLDLPKETVPMSIWWITPICVITL
ncbi:hypothetical protein SASPL_150304 [Salvia splendens]|uniref:Uncharacterized protein n=1 Tax=Salvia splendens TaxID=180675 RepID=A0A8X8W5Y6_SALSN|nr:hypothetical protein SASPL_150304 [Salvia splendens]